MERHHCRRSGASHLSGALCVALLLLASCDEDTPSITPTEDVTGPSQTLVQGETVVTTIGHGGHYFGIVLERGLVVLTLDTREHAAGDGYTMTAQLFSDEVRSQTLEVPGPVAPDGTALDGMNRAALFELSSLRHDFAVENGLSVPQDKAGCDGIFGECHLYGNCCDWHDKCFADNGCTGGLTSTTSLACMECNSRVVSCFTLASAGLPTPGIGWPGSSECCHQGPLGNICGAGCSEAEPGAWYKWGNHGCNGTALINFFCTNDWNGYNCFKYDGRNGRVTVVTDYACDASEGYCNDPFYCQTCPPDVSPACNPPIYTPGSFMDRLCTAPPAGEFCGDGACNGAESCGSCSQDCGGC